MPAPIRPVQGPGRFGPAGALPARLPPNALVNAPVGQRPFPVTPPPPGQVDGPRASEGLLDRVSTRIPTSKRLAIDPHSTSDISIGSHAMIPEGFHSLHYEPEHHEPARSAIADQMAKNAAHIREHYPFVNTDDLTDHGVHERFIEHAHDNLVHVWNSVRNEPWKAKAAASYWGLNRTAKEMAALHGGIAPRQAAATIAALSPDKDLDQNISLAERVIHSHRDHQLTPVSPEMAQREPSLKPGATLGSLPDPMQKALFIKAYDEAHRPDRGYDIISPYGERLRAMTPSGDHAHLAWGDPSEIASAVRALDSQNYLPEISRALGDHHRVRSFYNNIVAPDAAAFLPPAHGDVTVDPHTVNAGLLMPMDGSHPLMAEGNDSDSYTGAQGLSGLHADAIRRAAQTISAQEGRRYLPREVQSVASEAMRHMFRGEHKRLDERGAPAHPVGQVAEGAAYAARHGFMPPGMARAAIIQAAGGIKAPRWHSGDARVEDVSRETER